MARPNLQIRRSPMQGMWFPIGLAILLFLALPAFVLLMIQLVAGLFGVDPGINTWLQNHMNLTFNVALPWWALLLFLLIPALVALLYFLKLRRKAMQVPSTFLWKKSIEDMHVNSLFQWLRNNVLLLLQLLFLLLLVYAVMAFQMHAKTGTGKYYILMIDNSASMAVKEGDRTRLDIAKAEAMKEIDAHGDTDTGMVVEFNSRAGIRQPYTTDKALLRRAVEGIEQTQRRTRIDEALTLADSLANPKASGQDFAVKPENAEPGKDRVYVPVDVIAASVHLFSDGRFPDAAGFDLGNLELNYHRIGKPGPDVDNVGVVTLDATRDETVPGKVQVFVRVLNYRATPADVKVRLEVRGGGQADLKIYEQPEGGPLRLPARQVSAGDPEKKEPAVDKPGEGVVTFALPDLNDSDSYILHVNLPGHKDAFALDDEAWLVLGVVRKARVAIVTPGNKPLEDFFDQEAVAKVAQVTKLKPDDLKDEAAYLRPAREGGFDLVIFDRCAPENEEQLPAGNTFFIDNVPPPWKRADMPPLGKDTLIRNPASKHPVMKNLSNLDEIGFHEPFKFDFKDERVPPKVPKLLETGKETAVLFALPRRSFTDLVLTAALVDKGVFMTNWVTKLSFPIFLRNLLYTLGNVSDAAAEENVQPGEIKTLRPDVTVPEVRVTTPAKTTERLAQSVQKDFVFKNTDRVGVYHAAWAGGERDFAVNLLDELEGNLQPRDAIQVGDVQVGAGQTRGTVWDTWKWAIVLGVLVLLVEWALYHRRIFS